MSEIVLSTLISSCLVIVLNACAPATAVECDYLSVGSKAISERYPGVEPPTSNLIKIDRGRTVEVYYEKLPGPGGTLHASVSKQKCEAIEVFVSQ